MAEDTSLEYEPGVLRVFQTKDETKAFYNKIAKVYDLLAEHSEQPMRDIGIKMLAVQAGEMILEIGFGTGHCLVELAQALGPFGRVLGLDLSESMVDETRELIKEQRLEDSIELRSLLFSFLALIIGGVISGVFGGLWFTATELNISAIMGMTMVVGIVTEVSIFYISEYRDLSAELPRRKRLITAGANRFRAIAMTTLAAILALLPLAMAIGEGSAMQQPLAIAIVSGLVVQLPLVLVFMPALLSMAKLD
jgi:hypothetical protein